MERGGVLPPVWRYRGYVSFEWNKIEAGFEEEEIFAHARAPYHRVDVLTSSQHARVVIAGVMVAEARRPSLLFETTLPTRYYSPREDVRMELLEPTPLMTRGPYKGLAAYWSVKIEDHFWGAFATAGESEAASKLG